MQKLAYKHHKSKRILFQNGSAGTVYLPVLFVDYDCITLCLHRLQNCTRHETPFDRYHFRHRRCLDMCRLRLHPSHEEHFQVYCVASSLQTCSFCCNAPRLHHTSGWYRHDSPHASSAQLLVVDHQLSSIMHKTFWLCASTPPPISSFSAFVPNFTN